MAEQTMLPKRKHPRLKNYDYSFNGLYFVTICTKEKEKILSKIDPDGFVDLSPIGMEADSMIKTVFARFENVKVTDYVIMPNHIHMIIQIFQRPVLVRSEDYIKKPTLCDMVGAYKSLTSRACFEKYAIKHIFQKSFHEHIIRNKKSLYEIKKYIFDNPKKWKLDCFYSD